MKIIPNITLQDDSSGSPVYHAAGKEVDLDDAIAQDLVEKGHAAAVPGQVQTAKSKSLPKPRSNAKPNTQTDETGKGGDSEKKLDDQGNDSTDNGGGDGQSGSSDPSGQQSP